MNISEQALAIITGSTVWTAFTGSFVLMVKLREKQLMKEHTKKLEMFKITQTLVNKHSKIKEPIGKDLGAVIRNLQRLEQQGQFEFTPKNSF